jgi:hypothetical protein
MSGNLFAAGASVPGYGHNGGPPMLMDQQGFVGDAEQRVFGWFLNQISRIEGEVFETIYPDVRYRELVPIETGGDPWVQSIVYFSTDHAGQARWQHAGAQDVPMVNLVRNQFATTVQMASIGYGYNEEELAIAARLNQNLANDKADAARRAAEEFIDRVAMFGDATVGYTGLINNASVTAGSAANDGTGPSTLWSAKTPDLILRDINAALTGVWTGSLGAELADTILLSLDRWSYIATRRLDTTTSETTILQFIERTNVYTATTGRPLTIRAVYGLETAGAGPSQRMVAYRRDRGVLRFYLPMPFQFAQPWRRGPWYYEVPGGFRVGGVDVRRPSAMRYVDAI